MAVLALCLGVATGTPATGIAAESNLDHKMAPLSDAASKPHLGFGSGSLIVAPIPFSDPMIGAGLALGAGYLFTIDEGSDPSMLGGGIMRSQNGSEAYALSFNFAFLDNRWTIGATYIDGDVDYDLVTAVGEVPIEQTGQLIRFKVMYGITTDFHLGVGGRYLESTIRSSNPLLPNLPPEFRPPDGFSTTGISVLADYSSVDDTIYPTSGFSLAFSGTYNEPSGRFGEDYFKSILTYDTYFSTSETGVVAIRSVACSAPGRVPFYDLCSLGGTDSFRGYNITRFLDNALASAQIEYRKRLGKRIGVVAFGGVGAVGGALDELDDVGAAAGLGLRYRVSQKFPVDFSVDGSLNDEADSLLYIYEAQRF